MPRGFAIILAIYLAGRLVNRIDARFVMATGMILIGIAQGMMISFSLQMDEWPVIISGLVQGFGLGLVMVPMNLLAFATLPPEVRTSGAAAWSLSRNIGGSVMIAMFTALVARNLQVSHSDLAGELSMIRYPFLQGGMAEQFGFQSQNALMMIDLEVNRQALMVSYIDSYWLMTVMAFVLVPMTLLLRVQKNHAKPHEAMVME
jgi:DHA2 family multidrug resistance protein